MTSHNPSSIWTKIDYNLQPATTAENESTVQGPDLERMRAFWTWGRPVLDVVGAFLWVYALLKVFVADIDSDLIGSGVKYRFFFFLAVAVLLVLLLRKKWAILGGFAYVVGFPLVVVFWKIPKAIRKTRSAVVFFAAVNAVTMLVSDLKHALLAGAGAIFVALAIAVFRSPVVLGAAAAAVGWLLLRAIFRTVRVSVQPSVFLRMQQRTIRVIVDSKMMIQLMSPGDELRQRGIEKFTAEQQTAFVQKLANGVIAHRALGYWAYQLERYRRSPASLFFNAFSYLVLIIKAIVGLALLNLALYHASRSAFTFQARPTFLGFLRYVVAGLYGGEIGALHARSDVANALSIVTFVVGLVVLGSLVLSSSLAFRAARNESDIRDTVVEIRRESVKLEKRLGEEYQVSIDEAILRLQQLKYGLMGVITFLSTRIPGGFGGEPHEPGEEGT